MTLAPMLKKMLMGNAFMTDKGRVKMFEKMEYTLFPSRALALNLQKIGKKGGEKYLFDLGFKATMCFDKELTDTIHLQSGMGDETASKMKPIFDILGWGTFEYLKKEYTKDRHHFIVRLSNNPISEHAKKLFGKNSNVCSFLLGMHSAHTKILFGVDAQYKETRCITRGDPYCEFLSKR